MKGIDLKNSILQMAIQGKLVPQDPSDEPASALLERIREQRRQLIAEGKIKAPKGGESVIYRGSDGKHYEKRIDAKGHESESVCIEDEIPFEIPEGWEWTRLGSLCAKIGSGSTPAGGRAVYTTTGPILIRSQNVYDDGLRLDDVAHFNHETYSKRGSHVEARDILLNITGASIGRCAIVPDPFVEADVNQHVLILRLLDYSPQSYLHLAITSPVVQDAIMEQQVGATKEGLSATKASNLLIPLPPLSEQTRIRNRVDEVLECVMQYDALETAREKLDAELPDRLRKSILQMAVQGKLVPQDPSDEPASALLERIREQRRQLIVEGKMKAPKGGESVIYRASDGGYYEKRIDAKGRESEPICIDDEIPFEIPDSWAWARLGSLGTIIGGGTPKTGDLSLWASEDNGIPWLTPADMGKLKSRYVSRGSRFISKNGLDKSSAQLLSKGSVIMSSRAPIGYLAIAEAEVATNQGCKSISPALRDINEWILLSLDALMDSIKKRASGTTFKEISGSEFAQTFVPIPPALEQKRISSLAESTMKTLI